MSPDYQRLEVSNPSYILEELWKVRAILIWHVERGGLSQVNFAIPLS